MRRGYAIGLVLTAACSATRTWSTGGEANEKLRAILDRRDGAEAGLATPAAIYFVPDGRLDSERKALLQALRDAPVKEQPPVFFGFNTTGVVSWARPEVLEVAFEDGTLHVEWLAGRSCHVAFEQGRDVLWMDLQPSAKVDAAWRALDAAARAASRGTPDRGGYGDRPLQRMRDAGVEFPGIEAR
jgi:hypothetical protein